MKLSIALHQKSKNGYNIKICINKDSKPAYISTDVYISKKEQLKYGRIVSHPNASYINAKLSTLMNGYDKKMAELSNVRLEYMSSSEIRSFLLLKKNSSNVTLSEYANELITNISRQGRDNSVLVYKRAMNYWNNDYENLELVNITTQKLQNLYTKMHKNVNETTCGIYFRTIRAIYNHAIKNNIVKIQIEDNAFLHFQMPKTVIGENKNLTKEQLRLIFNTNYTNKGEQFAVDICKISFLLCGANFKDIFLAENIKDGRINYVREKTKRTKQSANIISIFVEQELAILIEKYKGSSRIFDFGYKYKDYINLLSYINRELGKVSVKLGLDFKLTTYNFRDTWATMAYNDAKLRTELIEYALGHSLKERKVTFTYIKLNLTELDEANRQIFNAIFNDFT